eukprot:gene29531-5877_t
MLVNLKFKRAKLVTCFLSRGKHVKKRIFYVPGALQDLQAADLMAQCPEEHANISKVRLTALLLLHRYKESGEEARKLTGHLRRAKDETEESMLLITPIFRQECAELIEIAGRAACHEIETEAEACTEVERSARAKVLYDSAGSLMAEGRHAQAAKAMRDSVELQPNSTEGYARLGQALEGAGDHVSACNVYVNAMKRDHGRHKSLIPALRVANDIARVFDDEFMQDLVVKKKCGACGATDVPLTVCSRCRSACYCCKEHQKQRWPVHKLVCKALTESVEDLADIRGGFAWGLKDELRSWEDVDHHFLFSDSVPRGFARIEREHLSVYFTLFSAMSRFGLEDKRSVCVHVVGADDIGDWTSFSSERCVNMLQHLPTPPLLNIVLVGPELACHIPLSRLSLSLSLSSAPICLSVCLLLIVRCLQRSISTWRGSNLGDAARCGTPRDSANFIQVPPRVQLPTADIPACIEGLAALQVQLPTADIPACIEGLAALRATGEVGGANTHEEAAGKTKQPQQQQQQQQQGCVVGDKLCTACGQVKPKASFSKEKLKSRAFDRCTECEKGGSSATAQCQGRPFVGAIENVSPTPQTKVIDVRAALDTVQAEGRRFDQRLALGSSSRIPAPPVDRAVLPSNKAVLPYRQAVLPYRQAVLPPGQAPLVDQDALSTNKAVLPHNQAVQPLPDQPVWLTNQAVQPLPDQAGLQYDPAVLPFPNQDVLQTRQAVLASYQFQSGVLPGMTMYRNPLAFEDSANSSEANPSQDDGGFGADNFRSGGFGVHGLGFGVGVRRPPLAPTYRMSNSGLSDLDFDYVPPVPHRRGASSARGSETGAPLQGRMDPPGTNQEAPHIGQDPQNSCIPARLTGSINASVGSSLNKQSLDAHTTNHSIQDASPIGQDPPNSGPHARLSSSSHGPMGSTFEKQSLDFNTANFSAPEAPPIGQDDQNSCPPARLLTSSQGSMGSTFEKQSLDLNTASLSSRPSLMMDESNALGSAFDPPPELLYRAPPAGRGFAPRYSEGSTASDALGHAFDPPPELLDTAPHARGGFAPRYSDGSTASDALGHAFDPPPELLDPAPHARGGFALRYSDVSAASDALGNCLDLALLYVFPESRPTQGGACRAVTVGSTARTESVDEDPLWSLSPSRGLYGSPHRGAAASHVGSTTLSPEQYDPHISMEAEKLAGVLLTPRGRAMANPLTDSTDMVPGHVGLGTPHMPVSEPYDSDETCIGAGVDGVGAGGVVAGVGGVGAGVDGVGAGGGVAGVGGVVAGVGGVGAGVDGVGAGGAVGGVGAGVDGVGAGGGVAGVGGVVLAWACAGVDGLGMPQMPVLESFDSYEESDISDEGHEYQLGPTQTGPAKLGPTQLGPTQTRGPAQLGQTQLGPTQTRGPTQTGPAQLGPTERGSTNLYDQDTDQLGPTHEAPNSLRLLFASSDGSVSSTTSTTTSQGQPGGRANQSEGEPATSEAPLTAPQDTTRPPSQQRLIQWRGPLTAPQDTTRPPSQQEVDTMGEAPLTAPQDTTRPLSQQEVDTMGEAPLTAPQDTASPPPSKSSEYQLPPAQSKASHTAILHNEGGRHFLRGQSDVFSVEAEEQLGEVEAIRVWHTGQETTFSAHEWVRGGNQAGKTFTRSGGAGGPSPNRFRPPPALELPQDELAEEGGPRPMPSSPPQPSPARPFLGQPGSTPYRSSSPLPRPPSLGGTGNTTSPPHSRRPSNTGDLVPAIGRRPPLPPTPPGSTRGVHGWGLDRSTSDTSAVRTGSRRSVLHSGKAGCGCQLRTRRSPGRFSETVEEVIGMSPASGYAIASALKMKVFTADQRNAGIGDTKPLQMKVFTAHQRNAGIGDSKTKVSTANQRKFGKEDYKVHIELLCTKLSLYQVHIELLCTNLSLYQVLPKEEGSFQRSCVDRFEILSESGNLGDILALKVWHEGEGSSAQLSANQHLGEEEQNRVLAQLLKVDNRLDKLNVNRQD